MSSPAAPTYAFLVDTWATEVEKTLSVWSMAGDGDLRARPRAGDRRGRNLLEHMVHQCTSEQAWFSGMLGITTAAPALPATETRLSFLQCYAAAAGERLEALRGKDDAWWTQQVPFFGVPRSRAWIVVRRIAHTAHHRGQQTMLLRMRGVALHSTYGPSADTGGLGKDQAPVIYPYADTATLLREEAGARSKIPLPGPAARAVTERPDAAS